LSETSTCRCRTPSTRLDHDPTAALVVEGSRTDLFPKSHTQRPARSPLLTGSSSSHLPTKATSHQHGPLSSYPSEGVHDRTHNPRLDDIPQPETLPHLDLIPLHQSAECQLVQPFLDKHVCLKSCGSDSSPDIRYPDDADELLAGLGDGTIIDD